MLDNWNEITKREIMFLWHAIRRRSRHMTHGLLKILGEYGRGAQSHLNTGKQQVPYKVVLRIEHRRERQSMKNCTGQTRIDTSKKFIPSVMKMDKEGREDRFRLGYKAGSKRFQWPRIMMIPDRRRRHI